MTEKKVNEENDRFLVLAYDVEATGVGGHVIAIGASVVDDHLVERDSFRACCFKPNEAHFELDCIEGFWLGTELGVFRDYRDAKPVAADALAYTPRDVLREIAAQTPPVIAQSHAELHAIDGFIAFVEKWGKLALAEKFTLMICSDNTAFDTCWINTLLAKYRPDVKPFPYSFLTGNYGKHYDVHQLQIGELRHHDSAWVQKYWGATKAINEIWDVPKMTKQHNHMPDFDAYTIAFDMVVLNLITLGVIKKRSTPVASIAAVE